MQDGWLAVMMIACVLFGLLLGGMVAVSMIQSECVNFGATTINGKVFDCRKRN